MRITLQRLRHIGDNLKARNGIVLYMGLILLCVVVLVCISYYSYSSALLSAQAQTNVSQQMQYAARIFQSELDNCTRIFNTLFLDVTFKNLVMQSVGSQGDYITTIGLMQRYLTTLAIGNEYPPVLIVCIPEQSAGISADGILSSSNSYSEQAVTALAQGGWARQALETGRIQYRYDICHFLSDAGIRRTGIAITSAVKGYCSLDKIAVVRLEQPLHYLAEPVQRVLNLHDGTLMILDDTGNAVHIAGRGAQTLTAADITGQIPGYSSDTTGNFHIQLGATQGTAFIERNATLGWQLLYVTNNAVLFESGLKLGVFSLVIAFGVVLLSFTLLMLSSQHLTRRLVQLTEAVKRVNAAHPLLDTHLSGSDEVGVLSRVFSQTLETARNAAAEKEHLQRDRYAIELQALQEQINPHFLYNTLSAVSAMAMRIEAFDIHDALVALSRFYRLSLSHGAGMIPIGEELRLIDLYMQICRLRFGDRLSLSLQVDPAVLLYKTPKLVVQPFIENAIMHGLQSKDPDIDYVEISIEEREDAVVFQIRDNGIGMDADQLRTLMMQPYQPNNHHAIASIDRRIKLHFGENYGVCIQSQVGKGTAVYVRIPKITDSPEL